MGQEGYEEEGVRNRAIYGSEHGINGNKNLQNWVFWGKPLSAEEQYYENRSLMWDKPDGDAEDNSESHRRRYCNKMKCYCKQICITIALFCIKGFGILNVTNNSLSFWTSLGRRQRKHLWMLALRSDLGELKDAVLCGGDGSERREQQVLERRRQKKDKGCTIWWQSWRVWGTCAWLSRSGWRLGHRRSKICEVKALHTDRKAELSFTRGERDNPWLNLTAKCGVGFLFCFGLGFFLTRERHICAVRNTAQKP